jgi:hypothetical protein
LLANRSDLQEGVLQALDKASGELAKTNVARDYSSAKRLLQPLHHDGKLKEALIYEFARDRRVEDVVMALSMLCSTQLDIIDRLMQGSHIDAPLIPCRAADLSWSTVKAITQLNPCHRTLTETKFDQLQKDYAKLSTATAQRIIRFWQVRSKTEGAG